MVPGVGGRAGGRPAGTHYWHSHMDGMQSARGLRGAFIVKKQPENDPVSKLYTEEQAGAAQRSAAQRSAAQRSAAKPTTS